MNCKPISIAVTLSIAALCLWGCGRQAAAPDIQAATETIPAGETAPVGEAHAGASSAQSPGTDIVLKTMEAPLSDGRVLTLSVLGKQTGNGCGVREITVSEGTQLRQSILIEEAIRADGVDGIDTGYSQCWSAEEAAALKDINFDGFLDLEVSGWVPNNSIPCYYWCWNPTVEQFEYAFTLQGAKPDPERQQLVAWYKVENGLYHTDYYHVTEDNKLELLHRDVEDVRPK